MRTRTGEHCTSEQTDPADGNDADHHFLKFKSDHVNKKYINYKPRTGEHIVLRSRSIR